MVRPTSRTRAPPTANRSARKKSGSPSAPTIGPRMPGFWCPTASGSMSRAVSESADGRCAMHGSRSEEHTSELQSRLHLVCRLLLEKKKHKYELQSRLQLVCRLLLEKKQQHIQLEYESCTPFAYKKHKSNTETQECS